MEKTRDHIRRRLKVLKDDRKYWEDLVAICVDDRAYYESQAVLKEALISELNWALRVLEEECEATTGSPNSTTSSPQTMNSESSS